MRPVGADSGRVVPADERAGYPLFAYGTLMFGEVLDGLIGRRPPVTAAVLPGWRAARLPGRVYPGLVPAPGGQAGGLLVTGLNADEWAVFDAFEGDPYLLREVALGSPPPPARPATPGAADQPVRTVLTYAWRDLDDVEDDDWDPGWFAAHRLGRYAARLRAW